MVVVISKRPHLLLSRRQTSMMTRNHHSCYFYLLCICSYSSNACLLHHVVAKKKGVLQVFLLYDALYRHQVRFTSPWPRRLSWTQRAEEAAVAEIFLTHVLSVGLLEGFYLGSRESLCEELSLKLKVCHEVADKYCYVQP